MNVSVFAVTNPETFHVLIQTILSCCNDFLGVVRKKIFPVWSAPRPKLSF